MEHIETAVITGAASGIGLATVNRFLAGGYFVHGLDIRSTGLPNPNNENYRFHQCDISDEQSVRHTISNIVDASGRIDVLVNNAGIVLVKPLVETSWDEFRRVVDTNLGGTFLMIKYVIPIMKRHYKGVIVNMASVSGHVGQVNHSLYGATKGGIIALCRALAWELSEFGIRVNSVSPGSVDTPMLRADVEGEAQRLGVDFSIVRREREEEQALKRWADPSEIAEVVYFLAGDSASFINGADILVDGGWVAK